MERLRRGPRAPSKDRRRSPSPTPTKPARCTWPRAESPTRSRSPRAARKTARSPLATGISQLRSPRPQTRWIYQNSRRWPGTERGQARHRAGDWARRGQAPVHRLQQVAKGSWVPWGDRVQQRYDSCAIALIALLTRQLRETQQSHRGARSAGRDWRVLQLLAPGDQLFAVGGGREEAAVLMV